jgi:tetratricopeptide (TPR) repeat protein
MEQYYFAQTALEKAYELDTSWPVTQYFLGITHYELGNFTDAIVYLNFAVKNGFEPALVVKRKLADIYLENKEYDKAATAYREALELNQEDVSSFVRPIWLYLDFLNQPQEALKLAELANTSFPNNAMALNLLGWSQIGTGHYSEAKDNLLMALELEPGMAAAYLNLGKLYELTDQKNSALESYKKAYELDQNGSIGRSAVEKYNALLAE